MAIKEEREDAGGAVDENVFDIQQGVAVLLAARGGNQEVGLKQADIFGVRSEKHSTRHNTATSLVRNPVAPAGPFYIFFATRQRDRY